MAKKRKGTMLQLESTSVFRAWLKSVHPEIQERARAIDEKQAKLALRAAIRKAPRDTGQLVESAYQRPREHLRNGKLERTEIGFSAPYAAYAEEMTLAAKAEGNSDREDGKLFRNGVQQRRRFLARAVKARKKPRQRAISKMIKELFAAHAAKHGLKVGG